MAGEHAPAEARRINIITHRDVLADPRLWPEYSNIRVAMIREGKSGWILRGSQKEQAGQAPETETAGIFTLDYYRGGKLVGLVRGSDEYGFDAYGPPIEDDEKLHKLSTEPLENEALAQRVVTDYLDQTYAGEGLA